MKRGHPPETVPTDGGAFPIVALGASAGGLDAFEQFLRAMPPDSGMGFVLVQHLDPLHPSLLAEILQRCTAMPVLEASDGVAIERNHVYVIPPGHDMDIEQGCLRLCQPSRPRGGPLPIDRFLRSLAGDQGEFAVAIVLSGAGTDGTLGLRAVHGAGGLCLVQDPATAEYGDMPTSAIRSGFATQVLAVDEMPAALATDARLRQRVAREAESPAAAKRLARVLMRLRSATGHDFSGYKKNTLERRIARRMALHQIADMAGYERHLNQHPEELAALFQELLINVTSFFRDPEVFACLKQTVLPALLAGLPEDAPLRIWVAGCSTGEEAYSLAMLLRELADELQRELPAQIYSTDIDADAIAVGRAGLYPPNIVQDVSPERLQRFFVREDKGWRVRKEIREMVVFALQSVVKDPPFTRLDLLCCRNLLIYLEPELQERLIPLFHYALNPGGVLVLSPAESAGQNLDLFDPVERSLSIYRARPGRASRHALLGHPPSWAPERRAPAPGGTAARPGDVPVAEIAKAALLKAFAPASVLVEANGDILYVHGRTGEYLQLAPGQPSNNILDMARGGLQLALREALRQAADEAAPAQEREVEMHTREGPQTVSLGARALAGVDGPPGRVLISFRTLARKRRRRGARAGDTAAAADAQRIEGFERELALGRQRMGELVEAQQLSNEELQSANEELQSTNEELETSKEELQSVNEELVTVNSELHSKVEQLTGTRDDMKNLLDNISVGAIFLDRSLNIRRYTHDALRVYRLMPSDLGRALSDIRSGFVDVDLLADVRGVLETLTPVEREVRVGENWYLARIQPYRTEDNAIDGVVLTFNDVTERVRAIADRRARELAEAIVDTVRDPLVVLDRELCVVAANRAYAACFGGPVSDLLGRRFYEIGAGQWDVAPLHELLDVVPPVERSFEARELSLEVAGRGRLRLRISARRVIEADGRAELVLLSIEQQVQPAAG